MLIPQLNKAEGRLLKKVGRGVQWQNEQGSFTLSYQRRIAATGLLLHARLAEQPIKLWLDERQWCQWVEPMLAVPSLKMTPQDLLELLACWTLADAGECRSDSDFPWPEGVDVEEGNIDAGMGWQLCILRDQRRLDLHLLAGSEHWLDILAENGNPLASQDETLDMMLCATLLAGWSRIAATQLDNLIPGDVLLLQKAWQVTQGKFALFIERPVASLSQDDESGIFMVEEVMSDFDDWMEVTPPVLTEKISQEEILSGVLVTVTVEVAQLSVSLQELSCLDVGDILSANGSYDGLVTLKVGNHPVARGTLLYIDSRLAVKIECRC